jgi:hypothetical protein
MKRALTVFVVGGILLTAACRAEPATSPDALSTPTTPAASSSSPRATPAPRVERRTVVEKHSISFSTRRVTDPRLARGTTKVTRRGVKGVLTLTYRVTFTDGRPTTKKLVRKVVTRAPVTRVITVGTRAARRCDPNYSGCVPIASDVDCAGGGGDGPAYVSGTVRVIGTDIYDLDRDGDGIGCD